MKIAMTCYGKQFSQRDNDVSHRAPSIEHTSVLGLKAIAAKCKAKKVIAVHHNPHGNLSAIAKEAEAIIPGFVFATDGLEIGLTS
jgi:ribonuclease BN (tRNA processing enzyme)